MARYNLEKTAFLLCDIQERFRPLIHQFADVVTVAETMVRASQVLKRPLVATEQYSKAFGKIVPELSSVMAKDTPVFEKKQFSMYIPEVKGFLEGANHAAQKMDTVVLFGIETHVCVQQTALDLLKDDYKVVLPVDGVSSQRVGDREVALALLRSAGATLTTTESLLYSLIGGADHPSFKELAKLVQEHNAKKATSLATLR